MHIKKILGGVRFRTKDDIAGLEASGVTDDSRAVRPGDLFIAVKGYSLDGAVFIGEAVKKGAGVILAEEDFDAPAGVRKILVDDARKALPVIAGNFYGRASDKLNIIGVTGTNGKTTITYIIESILREAGEDTGVIGTISYRIKDKVLPAKNTTPGVLELQSMLAEMVGRKIRYAAMEVSSHSLDQGRMEGISLDAGIFTNITPEHLDYHKTIDRYFQAKKRIFGILKDGGAAVLNNDDSRVASLRRCIKNRVLTYGIKNDADIKAEGIRLSLSGSTFEMITPAGHIEVKTKLVGMHNISNILAGAAAATAVNISLGAIRDGAASITSVPGRLEAVDAGQVFRVFVDYAHTEDALYNILNYLKKAAREAKIVTVFGCGGNRDRKKRPMMGKVACKLSDYVVITSDNPRFEEPGDIIEEIEAGVRGSFSNYNIVPDRRKAIEKALAMADAEDIVVIAGKGHENYQIIGDRVIHFDDREVAREILEKKQAVYG